MGEVGHHRLVTLGVTVEPAAPGSGVEVAVTAERLTLPLHVYGTVEGLRSALREHVDDALSVGPQGWPVTDLVVTLTESGYPPAGPSPADVRHTFVTVVRAALQAAGTVVCEPVDRFRVETPTETVAAVTALLVRHRGLPDASRVRGGTAVLVGTIPSGEVDAVRAGLPTAAHGLAVLESALDHHAPRARR
jgi:ribosomal protection tetracycline resistance protein